MAATHAADLLQHDAEAALAEARAIAPSASSKLVNGAPVAVLLEQADAERATLIAVGSVSERVAHQAGSSVLVVRPGDA